MPKIKQLEEILNEATPEVQPDNQAPETTTPAEELTPDDGQPTPPEVLAAEVQQSADFLPHGLTTTTNNYTQEEFRQKFAAVLEFLENPAVANDCVTELITNGRNLTADKIYKLASRYRWLNWIIDSRTQLFADGLQIAAFLAIETNLIVMNWTGLNMFERFKIWLKSKAEQRKQAQSNSKRRSLFGWVFSARPDPERPTEQSNYAKD